YLDEEMTFSDGLTVVHGANETGKTTLRHFMLGVLFGFTTEDRKRYDLRLDRPFGGSIRVRTDTGDVLTFTRLLLDPMRKEEKRVVTNAKGSVVESSHPFLEQLSRWDRSRVQAMFSFSVYELADFGTKGMSFTDLLLFLSADGRDVLLQHASHADERMREKFKRKGKNPTINARIEEIRTLNEQLRAQKRAERLHRDELRQLQEIKEKYEMYGETERTIERQLVHIQPYAMHSRELETYVALQEAVATERNLNAQFALVDRDEAITRHRTIGTLKEESAKLTAVCAEDEAYFATLTWTRAHDERIRLHLDEGERWMEQKAEAQHIQSEIRRKLTNDVAWLERDSWDVYVRLHETKLPIEQIEASGQALEQLEKEREHLDQKFQTAASEIEKLDNRETELRQCVLDDESKRRYTQAISASEERVRVEESVRAREQILLDLTTRARSESGRMAKVLQYFSILTVLSLALFVWGVVSASTTIIAVAALLTVIFAVGLWYSTFKKRGNSRDLKREIAMVREFAHELERIVSDAVHADEARLQLHAHEQATAELVVLNRTRIDWQKQLEAVALENEAWEVSFRKVMRDYQALTKDVPQLLLHNTPTVAVARLRSWPLIAVQLATYAEAVAKEECAEQQLANWRLTLEQLLPEMLTCDTDERRQAIVRTALAVHEGDVIAYDET
ncbi:MAG: AAA family ATPase, partial [Bacilli bacterium]